MAIAFDSKADPAIQNPGTSLTYSLTNTAGDLIYSGELTGNATITHVKYNASDPFTVIGARTPVVSLYLSHSYLVSPDTGTHNMVVTVSSSVLIIAGATTYSGVDQTSPLDANQTNGETTEATTTTTLTTVADNCWTVLTARGNSSGITNAGTGTTQRANTNGYIQLYDGNGAVTPAGSTSLQTTQTSQPTGHQMASFAPATEAAATDNALAWCNF